MTRNEQNSLLETRSNNSYGSITQKSINSDYTSININDEQWIQCTSRYQGTTFKKRDENNNWQYETVIKNNNNSQKKIIKEQLISIRDTQRWEKITYISNEDINVELSKLNFDNNTLETYHNQYTNFGDYIQEKKNLNFQNFQKKTRELESEYQEDLENLTIKAISGINDLIKSTNELNKKIKNFKNNQNNGDLNTLLKIYKYLTVIQNFIDEAKPTTSKFTNFFKKIGNLTLGVLEIYIGLTGKNLQRVVSNYPIDGKEHTFEDYTNAIFWNPANYIMVLIDTALGTFCTSAASNWARDVFFNKQNKTNSYQINEFNSEWFDQYKETFQLLLFEENHQQLMNHFAKISEVNTLMQKFNEATNCNEEYFNYHPKFTKEIKQITKKIEAIDVIEINTNNNNENNEIKQLVSSTNKAIKTLEVETENKKPVALTKNWGYNLLSNLGLETAIWACSHVILTGSSENTAKESFNLQDWITKDIFSKGALVANISRYFVMRPINNIFKSGLTNLGIPTNLTPNKLAVWIEKQPRYKKVLMAIPLFLAVTFTVNAVKTEAALVTEYGFEKAAQVFKEKFFRWTTLGFSIGVTAIDMITFAISDFYQKVVNQPITIKQITDYFQLTRAEKTFIENHLPADLLELEKNDKFPNFNEEIKKRINTNDATNGYICTKPVCISTN